MYGYVKDSPVEKKLAQNDLQVLSKSDKNTETTTFEGFNTFIQSVYNFSEEKYHVSEPIQFQSDKCRLQTVDLNNSSLVSLNSVWLA